VLSPYPGKMGRGDFSTYGVWEGGGSLECID